MPLSRPAPLSASIVVSLTILVGGGGPLHAQAWGVLPLRQSASVFGVCTLQPTAHSLTCPDDGAGTGVLDAPPVAATARASAAVGGPLGAASTLEVTNGTADSYTVFARAGYYDALTISGPVQPAFARFTVSGEGTAGSSTDHDWGAFPASYGILFFANYGAASIPSVYPNASPLGTGVSQFLILPNGGQRTGSILVPLVAGVNNFLFGFGAVSRVGRPTDVPAGASWSGSAIADYSHTGRIDGLSFVDALGNDVTGRVTATFASGVTFAAAPEPATLALVACGLAVLLVLARRRGGRARAVAGVVGLLVTVTGARASAQPQPQRYAFGAESNNFNLVAVCGTNVINPGAGSTTADCTMGAAHYQGFGSAVDGEVKASARLTLSGASAGAGDRLTFSTSAMGYWGDRITFLPGSVLPASVALTLQWTGALSAAAINPEGTQDYTTASASWTFNAASSTMLANYNDAVTITTGWPALGYPQSGSATVSQTRTFVLPVDPGLPLIDVWYSITTGATFVQNVFAPGSKSAAPVADFSHTAKIVGLSFTDAAGAPITSGVDYRFANGANVFAPTAVPEPATVALLAGGLGGVLLAARRRRRPSATLTPSRAGRAATPAWPAPPAAPPAPAPRP